VIRRTLRYGPHRPNVADLWLPGGHLGEPERSPPPVVALLHGGSWGRPGSRRQLRRLAGDVVRHRWAAYTIEYRHHGRFGGGGWPSSFLDVAAALDHLASIDGVDAGRVAVCGYSAGAQLALWAAGRLRLASPAPGAAPALRPVAAISLAGVLDRCPQGSPVALLPLGLPQLLVHGLADRTVPAASSERYAEQALAVGDPVELVTLRSLDHAAMLDPDRAAWQVTVARLGGWLGDHRPGGRPSGR